MATADSFFYWYRRYRVTAQDMTDFQSALANQARGLGEGAYNGSVLSGFTLDLAGGMDLDVSAGVAIGPTGYLHAVASVQTVSAEAPTGSLPCRSIVVSRPKLTPEVTITKPTSPFEPVALRQRQDSEVVVIQGTPSATPDYPSKEDGDVILAGLRLAPGQTSLAASDLDFEVREVIGVNAEHAQHVFRYDDRLRPFRSDSVTVGIKPSQTTGSKPKLFTYPGRGTPSLFPKTSGGLFNSVDTLLDMATGAITGGDDFSADFTPQVATGNNSIVATLVLLGDDSLAVRYGTQGTLAQCLAAIENQVSSGAGAIDVSAGSYKIAYVVLTSRSGTLSDCHVIDARPLGGGGGGGGGTFVDVFGDSDSGNAASDLQVSGYPVLQFMPELEQRARALVQVPSSYSQGSPIKLRVQAFTANITGDTKTLSVTTSLIRKGVDAIGSTANQHIDGQSITGASPSNLLQEMVFELTDPAGQVNGVVVNPGDELEIDIAEDGTSTGTDELNVRKRGLEVTFT